jgi:hypothetical protein
MLLHTSPQLANDVVGSFWPGRVQKTIITELKIRQSWENNCHEEYRNGDTSSYSNARQSVNYYDLFVLALNTKQ